MYFDRTDLSEGIDPTKSNRGKESMICHYWVLNNGFKFQDSVCNGCHDLTILWYCYYHCQKCYTVLFITLETLKQLIY